MRAALLLIMYKERCAAATKLQLRRGLLIFQRLIFSRALSYFIRLIITLPPTNENVLSAPIIAGCNSRESDARNPNIIFPTSAIRVIGFRYGRHNYSKIISSTNRRRLAFQSRSFRLHLRCCRDSFLRFLFSQKICESYLVEIKPYAIRISIKQY